MIPAPSLPAGPLFGGGPLPPRRSPKCGRCGHAKSSHTERLVNTPMHCRQCVLRTLKHPTDVPCEEYEAA